MGVALAGAGHGSPILGYLFLSPTVGDWHIFFGLFIWAIVGGLLPWLAQWYVSLFATILIAINYLGAANDIKDEINSATIYETGAHYVFSFFEKIPELAIPLWQFTFLFSYSSFGKLFLQNH